MTTKTTPSEPEVCCDALLAVDPRISKLAAELGLVVTKYEGYSRGRWGSGDGTPAPPGMWVFNVSPESDCDDPFTIVEANLPGALKEMRSAAEYFNG